MVAIDTINIMEITAKCVRIKSISIWLYEYEVHSMMNSVHHIEMFEYAACVELKFDPVLHYQPEYHCNLLALIYVELFLMVIL